MKLRIIEGLFVQFLWLASAIGVTGIVGLVVGFGTKRSSAVSRSETAKAP